ncbi:MAG: 4Fe-4S binding protein [Proteobacteria bacterium]|nr:4Fe-4S binding protein [Pseudomonadota bacterium]
MPKAVYIRLREQLDQYSVGFPVTESGVEYRILERLFTEDEADLFLHLGLKVESAEEVARRTGRDPAAAAALLAGMDEKGTVFPYHKGDQVRYGAVPFLIGIYEFQLPRIDREMAELYEQYFQEAFLTRTAEEEQLLRPIPVGRSLDISLPVATYNDVRQIVRQQELIAVAPCLCRVQAGLLDQGCGKPLDVCFTFGSGARHYIDRGAGREVSQEEALELLTQAEAAGLVPQPTNSQSPNGMCNCCGDCCAGLRALKMLDKPARAVQSDYCAVVDPDACTGCEICLDRCQMEAIAIEEEVARVDPDRCIGCGLCVTTCPAEALRLDVKPEDEYRAPHATARELMISITRERGTSMIPLIYQKRSGDR